MTKQFNFSISVKTKADVTGELVQQIVNRLIETGVSDAHTIRSCEGDLESAELVVKLSISSPRLIPKETSVAVKHWDAYCVEGTVDTHQFDIEDLRSTSGQAHITVGALEGHLDDMLSVTMEVNADPLNPIDHVPCAHVHIDSDSLAFSLFKIDDKILMRPGTNIRFQSFSRNQNGILEELFWIEQSS